MFQGEEKRKYIRVILDIPCKFSSLDYPAEEVGCRIVDLSVGGFSIETAAAPTVGETLKFNMSLPGIRPLEFSGQVLREVSEQKYALSISKISPGDRIKLGDFILTRLEEQNYIIKKFLNRKDAEN